jgi:HAD superfamily hydrolase (TIGR01549 family)
MSIRAVLFDMGDTLWHFPELPPAEIIRGETVHRIAELLRSWGEDPAGELFFLAPGIRFAIERATDEAYWGDLASPDYPALAKQVAAERGLAISDEQAVELWYTWNLGGVFLGRQLYEGVLDTMRWLRQQGYRIGAVTNRGLGGEPFREELRHHGLREFFEVLSISSEVGYLKPHPRIFQHALEELGLEPEETVMVGDSLRADVGGAKALNMNAVWKRNETSATEKDIERDMAGPEDGEAEPAEPDFAVDKLWELTTLPIFKK